MKILRVDWLAAVCLAAAALSGCAVVGDLLPTALAPAAQPPAPVEPASPADVSPTDPAVTAAPSPTAQFPDAPSFQPMQAGQSVQFGAVIFTLTGLDITAQKTVVSYRVDGLSESYAHLAETGDPYLMLPGGQTLPLQEGGGGGGQGYESGQITFAALPPGTPAFTVVIPNSWNGNLAKWEIPIRLKK